MPPKITVIQPENRPNLDYFLLSKAVNEKMCAQLGYNYKFILIETKYTKIYHPATAKIFVLNDYLQTSDDDAIIFLDSDAWIQTPSIIDTIITHLLKTPDKHGCFSRDLYFTELCSFINSGSFILKVNDYTKQMLQTLISYIHTKLHNFNPIVWPFDQYYYSEYVFNHKDDFIIFIPMILNTPYGIGLRHNWTKKPGMYYDLNKLLTTDTTVIPPNREFSIEKKLDTKPYPNTKPSPKNFPGCFSY
jgi:hypothetical protein